MLATNTIHNMDVVDGLKQISDNSADVVLCDPPYNIGKKFGDLKYDLEIGEYCLWCDEWIDECVRILKPSGTIFIYGFSEILAHLSVRMKIPHQWLIWHYTNKTTPSLNFWQRSHESIVVGWKDKKARIFNRDKVREPYTDAFIKNAAGKKRKATKGRFSRTDKVTTYQAHEQGALPRDVLRHSALAGGAGLKERWFFCEECDLIFPSSFQKNHSSHTTFKHPTQKPLKLTKRLLLSASPGSDGLVVIPFAGSGSEALVARSLGLDYVGFEINTKYCRMANLFAVNKELEEGLNNG